MRLRGQVIGAVSVLASNATTLTAPEVEAGQALADVATVDLLQERSIREARLLNEQLRAALNSRIVIEQAKGVLAERRLIEMDATFETLRSYARNTNQKLSDVAHALVAGTLSGGTPHSLSSADRTMLCST
jgi:hypothetical protein